MAICNNKQCSVGECDQTETCTAYVPVMTNADRIRNMSDAGLAIYLCDSKWDCHSCAEYERLGDKLLLHGVRCDEECVKYCLEWLKKLVE